MRKNEKPLKKGIELVEDAKLTNYKQALILLISSCEFEILYRHKKLPVVKEAIKKIKNELEIGVKNENK